MTKRELLQEYRELCQQKRFELASIDQNSNKSAIQTAIDCLGCTDAQLAACMDIFKNEYPNIYNEITKSGDWTRDKFYRLYVFVQAKIIDATANYA